MSLRMMILLTAVMTCAGCGRTERPYTNHSQDPQAYALDVKTLVLDHVMIARKSREPADQVRLIVMELEDSPKRPVGEFNQTYAEMLTAAQSLLADCEQADGRPNGLEKRLDELAAMAESLPGSVNIRTEPES